MIIAEIEQRNLSFELLEERIPHVYISREHPLADREIITSDDLVPYPYVKYYQGQNSMQFYSEEAVEDHEADKTIIVTDSSALTSILGSLDAYTIGGGKSLGSRFAAIPYDTNEVIELGIIKPNDRVLSPLCQQFIKELKKIYLS